MIDLFFKVLLLVVIFAVLVVFILIKEIKRRREEIKVYIPFTSRPNPISFII
jgi:preprotein translocase subunit YajC